GRAARGKGRRGGRGWWRGGGPRNRSCSPRGAVSAPPLPAGTIGAAASAGAGAADPPQATQGMVFIPGGTFIMGTSAEQARRLVEEYRLNPDLFANQKHQVVHLGPFWIDRYEVTNRQYRDFLKATGRPPPTVWDDQGYPKGKDDCAFNVAELGDALAYARWAGKRLPTEAEWEKAARG